MKASFIEIENINIAYCEQNSEADKTVFFIHGNSGSSKMWSKQFDDNNFANCRMIAIDLPGHGASSKCTNPKKDYSPLTTARILAKALKALIENKPYFLVGFSYGTNLIAEVLPYNFQPTGIVFASACIVGRNYGPDKVIINFDSIFLQQSVEKKVAEQFLHDQNL